MFSAIRDGVVLKKVAALPDVKNLSMEEEVRLMTTVVNVAYLLYCMT